MNLAVISGTIPNAPKLSNGVYGAWCNGSIVSKNGEKRIYVPFVAYGEISERLSRINDGTKVSLTCFLDTYKDRDDNYRLSLNVKDFEIIEGSMTSVIKQKQYW